jgi:hypothetical protein
MNLKIAKFPRASDISIVEMILSHPAERKYEKRAYLSTPFEKLSELMSILLRISMTVGK